MSGVNYTYTVLIFNFTIKTIRSRLLSLYTKLTQCLYTRPNSQSRGSRKMWKVFSQRNQVWSFSAVETTKQLRAVKANVGRWVVRYWFWIRRLDRCWKHGLCCVISLGAVMLIKTDVSCVHLDSVISKAAQTQI